MKQPPHIPKVIIKKKQGTKLKQAFNQIIVKDLNLHYLKLK